MSIIIYSEIAVARTLREIKARPELTTTEKMVLDQVMREREGATATEKIDCRSADPNHFRYSAKMVAEVIWWCRFPPQCGMVDREEKELEVSS